MLGDDNFKKRNSEKEVQRDNVTVSVTTSQRTFPELLRSKNTDSVAQHLFSHQPLQTSLTYNCRLSTLNLQR